MLILSVCGRSFCEEELQWNSPTKSAVKLLEELFTVQPDDVLTWIHSTIWRLRTEELSSKRARDIDNYMDDVLQERGSASWLQMSSLDSYGKPFHNSSGEDSFNKMIHGASTESLGGTRPMLPRKIMRTPAGVSIAVTRADDQPSEVFKVASTVSERFSSTLSPVRENETRRGFPSSFATLSKLRPPAFDDTYDQSQSECEKSPKTPSSTLASLRTNRHSWSSRQSYPMEASPTLGTSASSGRISRAPESLATYSDLEDGDRKFASWGANFGIDSAGPNRTLRPVISSRQNLVEASHQWEDKQRDYDACILSPLSKARLTLDVAFFLCLLFEVWMVPWEIVFLPHELRTPVWCRVLVWLSLSCFMLDIVLNFTTGVIHDGEIVMNRRAIVKKYLSGWFWIDIVATLPSLVVEIVEEPIEDFAFGSVLRTSSLLRISRGLKTVRMLKGLKLIRAFRFIRSHRQANILMKHVSLGAASVSLLRLFQMQLLIALGAHLHGLLWATLHSRDWQASTVDQAYEKYLESFWWAYGKIMAAPGFVDAEAIPEATSMRLLDILIMAERFAAIILCVGRVTYNVLLDAMQYVEEYTMQQNAMMYLQEHRVELPMRLQLFQNLQETSKVRMRKKQFEKMTEESIPTHLRQHLCDELWVPRLLSFEMISTLATWDKRFVHRLAILVREEVVASRVIVFAVGEASIAAFYIMKGALVVSSFDSEEQGLQGSDYTSGMWIGEKALVNPHLRRNENVICRSWSELMSVPALAFQETVSEYDLTDRLELLLRKKLWLGLCGRCGVLGDHYANNCPLFNSRWTKVSRMSEITKWARHVAGKRTPSVFDSLDARPDSTKQEMDGEKDLDRFLADQHLQHLAPALQSHGIRQLDDLNISTIDSLLQDPAIVSGGVAKQLSVASIRDFKKRIERTNTMILSSFGSNGHLIFISHYKIEAGTEAALMQKEFERLIQEDPASPGNEFSSPVFLDTEDLTDLRELQTHVRNSHNLILLLTKGVLSRPWVLVELVTAARSGVRVVPVAVQRPGLEFSYPGEDYYERLRNGVELGTDAITLLNNEGITLEDLETVVRRVFMRIASPFSPHKSANIRQAELEDILKNCMLRSASSAKHPKRENGDAESRSVKWGGSNRSDESPILDSSSRHFSIDSDNTKPSMVLSNDLPEIRESEREDSSDASFCVVEEPTDAKFQL